MNPWKAAAAVVCLSVGLSGCSSVAQGFADARTSTGPKKAAKLTCSDLAGEAVRVSKENDAKPLLIKVRKPKVKKDNSATYKLPTGDKEALILSCTGTGVFSSGDTIPVLLKYTIDSDGEVFYGYEPL